METTTEKKQIEVCFFKGKNNKVLTRMPSGKLAIIDFNYKGMQVREGETWLVDVVKEEEKKVIVHPKELVATAKQNQSYVSNKINDFADKGWKVGKSKSYKNYGDE